MALVIIHVPEFIAFIAEGNLQSNLNKIKQNEYVKLILRLWLKNKLLLFDAIKN